MDKAGNIYRPKEQELQIVAGLAGKIIAYFETHNQAYLDASYRCKNMHTSPELKRRRESTRQFHIDYSETTRRLEEADRRLFQALYDDVTKEANALISKITADVSPLPEGYDLLFSLSPNIAHAKISSPGGNKYTLDLNNSGQLVMEYKQKVGGLRGKINRVFGHEFEIKSETIPLRILH